ncbi:MAG TPA: iron ABC transporter permease [Candidatus Blautia gallistercoris]|uniref:Iron ABC transporter permease n=1 Tax=Candidatus Blautia gallistercoris TaxID=2838490 RepID=A0A9D1WHX1_9FIRM|nr:iron ABC transporter permease [Candidatus Blautia gallistercoris]
MKHSMDLHTVKIKKLCAAGAILLIALAAVSLFTGKYPLTLEGILSGDTMQTRVFWTLRVGRTAVGVIGGFALGTAGFVYQTVFRNPLASPDVIGVSSGASAGAAAGILFLSGAASVTAAAFAGALAAVTLALALSSLDRAGRNGTIVLAGIAVHSLAQTILMCLKLTADPERELASIEYWIMGSLNGISGYSIQGNLVLCGLCMAVLFLMHRQILLLSAEEGEARMLGVSVGRLRLAVLLTATLAVASVVSLSGLISFVGLLAPHGARLLSGRNGAGTMLLGGLLGGALLTGADILARSIAAVELPVSIFTSLIGAPFLIYLIIRGRREV